MATLTLDISPRAIFVDLHVCSLWARRLTPDETPFPHHPKDRRWGFQVDEGEACLYLGRIFVIFTPYSVLARERRPIVS